MSKLQRNLADQLAAAVTPVSGDTTPTKAVTKTLRQLAKQLTKQQSKQARAAQPTPLTAKRARKALAGELDTALQPYLRAEETPDAKTPKSIAKVMKRLTSQLVKARHKQAKQTAKQAKLDAKQTKLDTKQATKATQLAGQNGGSAAPATKIARKQAARPSAPLKARRTAAATKHAMPKAVAPTLVEADNA